MSEQSAAWEYKEESPCVKRGRCTCKTGRRAWLVLLGAVAVTAWARWSTRWILRDGRPPMSAPAIRPDLRQRLLGPHIFAGIIAGARPPWRWALATLALCIGITIALAGYRRASGTNCSCGPRNSFRCCLPFCFDGCVALFSPR
ncbi:MAG: hypothetical protein ACLSTO_02445 [Bilophila wadsworthia]